MATSLDLPKGFEDAPEDVQKELLATYPSESLVASIREEVGASARSSPSLNKRELAEVLIALSDDA